MQHQCHHSCYVQHISGQQLLCLKCEREWRQERMIGIGLIKLSSLLGILFAYLFDGCSPLFGCVFYILSVCCLWMCCHVLLSMPPRNLLSYLPCSWILNLTRSILFHSVRLLPTGQITNDNIRTDTKSKCFSFILNEKNIQHFAHQNTIYFK